MIFWVLLACFGNRHVRKIQSLAASEDIEALSEILLNTSQSYLREEAIRAMTRFPDSYWTLHSQEATIKCVESEKEHCSTRGYCAYALGKIQAVEAVGSIVSAMEECDSESRYWMLLGLEPLAAESSLAQAQIAALEHDVDIFIRTRARNRK
jgi:hypothetical protein